MPVFAEVLRISEALTLTWRDVDLATIAVLDSKTAQAFAPSTSCRSSATSCSSTATLRDVVPYALVFGTSTGGRQSETNVRRRVLAPAVQRASERLEADAIEPLPEGLTPHSLRRTFASVFIALLEDPAYVIEQLGHTGPRLTLRLYAKAMGRRDGERERLRALVEGRQWALMGSSDAPATPTEAPRAA